jgi:hypothetical protein
VTLTIVKPRKLTRAVWNYVVVMNCLGAVGLCDGCSGVVDNPMVLPLRDGRKIADLLSDADSSVVIIVDPSECLACNAALHAVLEIRRGNEGRVILVLSRDPTSIENRQFVLAGYHADAVLRSSMRTYLPKEPIAILWTRHLGSRVEAIQNVMTFIGAIIPHPAPLPSPASLATKESIPHAN